MSAMFCWFHLILLMTYIPKLVGKTPEYIPLTIINGISLIDVRVEKARHNVQRMLFDTGSPHTYLIDLSDSKKLFAIHGRLKGGYHKSLISPRSFAKSIDASLVDFVDGSGVVFQGWVRRTFRVGSREWDQKFAIATIPPGRLDEWDPDDTGLIGASPISRFVQKNPVFSILTFGSSLSDQDSKRFFVFSNLPKSRCRHDGPPILRVPLGEKNKWSVSGILKFGEDFVFNKSPQRLLVDTGAGVITYPRGVFEQFRNYILSLGIPTLKFYDIKGERFFALESEYIHLVPPVIVESLGMNRSGKLIIPPRSLFRCLDDLCRLIVSPCSGGFILGLPLFRVLNVEFNSRDKSLSFCEPSVCANDPPLVQMEPPLPPLPPSKISVPKPSSKYSPSPKLSLTSPDEPIVSGSDLESLKDEPFMAPRLPDDLVDDKDDHDLLPKSAITTYGVPRFLLVIIMYFVMTFN